MKKLLTLSIVICLILQMFCIIPVFAEYDGMCGDNAYWDVTGGVLTISGTGNMYDYDYWYSQPPWLSLASTIRTVVIEEGITSIGQCAFSSDENNGEEYVFSILTDVQIANTVTTIRRNAFAECTILETVHIPASVTEIEDSVFVNCYAIKGFSVDENNAYYKALEGVIYSKDGTELKAYPIGSPRTQYALREGTKRVAGYAFSQAKKLEKIEFNEGLTDIDDEAFFCCEGLTQVKLPDSIKYLGGGVFQNCIALEYVRIPETVEVVGALVLDNTAYYNNLDNWDDGLLYLDKILLSGLYTYVDEVNNDFIVLTKQGHVAVRPETVLIANEAFFLTDVTSVYLPETLKRIGFAAFAYLSDLESVYLPDSLIDLGDSAFGDCEDLTEVRMGPNLERIGSGAFNNTAYASNESNYTDGLLYYDNYLIDYYPTLTGDVVIREGTTLMADGAFFYESGYIAENDGCKLSSVTFPESLTKISEKAFLDCTNMKTVEIPSHITEIGEYAFGYYFNYDYDADRVRYSLINDYLIKCDKNSAAEAYATLNGIDYSYLPKKAERIEIEGNRHLVGYSYEDSFDLNVKLYPEDAEESVKWSSNNENVATVSNGTVILREIGTATITAYTNSGLSDSITVTSLEKSYIMLEENNEISFTYEGEKRKYYFSPSETSKYSFSVTGDAEVIFNIYEGGRMKASYDGAFSHNFLCGGGYEIVVECTNNPSDFSFTAKKHLGSGGGADMEVTVPTELIIVKEPTKKTYEVGEELDLTGLQVAVKYSDGTLMAMIGGYEISGYYKDQFGIQTIVVSAYGLSDQFYVEVFEKSGYDAGDINGDYSINAADLALLKKVIAGLTPIDDEGVKNPDVDGEGDTPNAADLALLKKKIAGLV